MTPEQEKELIANVERIAYQLEWLMRYVHAAAPKLGILGVPPPGDPKAPPSHGRH